MNDESIVNYYKIILDFFKNILTYLMLFTIFTIIFGYIHISAFLYGCNHSWLINFIEYKTFISWGISISLIVFISFLLIFSDHFEFKKNFQTPIQIFLFITMIISLILIAITEFYYKQYIPILYLALISQASSFAFLDISRIVDDFSNKKSILSGKKIWWIITLPVPLFGFIFAYGNMKGYHISKGEFKTIAQIQNKKFGVIINNNYAASQKLDTRSQI